MKFDYKDSAPIPTKASWQRSGTAADNEPTDALKALLEVADPYKYARQTDTVEQSETFLNGKFPGGSLTEETISSIGTLSAVAKGDAPGTNKTTVDGDVQDRVAAMGYGVKVPWEWKEVQAGRRTWDNETHDQDALHWIPELIGRVAKTGGRTTGDPDMAKSHDALYWGCVRMGGMPSTHPDTTESGHVGFIKTDLAAEWDDLGE